MLFAPMNPFSETEKVTNNVTVIKSTIFSWLRLPNQRLIDTDHPLPRYPQHETMRTLLGIILGR